MAPKRKDRDSDGAQQKIRLQQQQHDTFLNAYSKPTQIYRTLRTRNQIKPIFLQRTLTYMKRMSRVKNSRTGFKVDSLLSKKEKQTGVIVLGDFLSIIFLGFYDKYTEQDSIRCETNLIKFCHNKRKDTNANFTAHSIGISDVQVNPNETDNNRKIPALTISSETFKNSVDPNSRSYVLQIRVNVITTNTDPKLSEDKRPKTTTKIYGNDLVLFNRFGRPNLVDGIYEIIMNEIPEFNKITSPKKSSEWIDVDNLATDIDFSEARIIKYKIVWGNKPIKGIISFPLTQSIIPTDLSTNFNNNTVSNLQSQKKDLAKSNLDKNGDKIPILYQFMLNNVKQSTQVTEDIVCPWCTLSCEELYILLKHLKLCHSRFTFTYVPAPNIHRIDVSINEHFDGSYVGSPHDLLVFAQRKGPLRRTSVTRLLVCRPRRPKPSLTEFVEVEDSDLVHQQPLKTGHNRLYHHTMTCLPVCPEELGIDSEDEGDPQWLQHKTKMMIDEFTDVNEGEKELMKLWNLHVMKDGYVGDCQIAIACDKFLDKHGIEILSKSLFRNFVLHLTNLFDYGLLSPEDHFKTMVKLRKLLSQSPAAIQALKEERATQNSYWKTTGILKFEEQQKKDLLKNVELSNKKKEMNGTKTSNSPMVRRKTNITNLQNKVGTSSGIKRRFSQVIESTTRAGTNSSDASKSSLKRRKSVSVNLVSNKKMSLVVTKVK